MRNTLSAAKRYEDLQVWQKARQLTRVIYDLTRNNHFSRDWSLRNQMRGAAVSIMSNIAEGFTRRSDKDFRNFLFIAKSSAAELQSHCYVSFDQSYLTQMEFSELYESIDHVCRMLANMIKYLDDKVGTTRHTRPV